MTDALSAVARGIGIDVAPDYWWVDGDDKYAICKTTAEDAAVKLRTYLLTGDRPLRIMEAYGIGCVKYAGPLRWVRWKASSTGKGAHGNTPAEAILACAMECV